MIFLRLIGEIAVAALAMFWQTAWALALGFALSAVIGAVVSKDAMRRQLGRSGVREIALAAAYGAVSSSCSYASAAIARALFRRGAGLIPSLAFMFASTNLVVEIAFLLFALLGWQFALAEWVGGIVLITMMSLLVKATYPRALVEEARARATPAGLHEHKDASVSAIAQNFRTNVMMVWQDLALGFLISGTLAVLIPPDFWRTLFAAGAPPAARLVLNAVEGALIAVVTFVCSIGNVPLAAILWRSGLGFAGVLSFLYADLIVIPLLDVYRKYYGARLAAYIGAVFFATMVLSGIVVELIFTALRMTPAPRTPAGPPPAGFSLNITFWLNCAAAGLAAYLFNAGAHGPARRECCSSKVSQ